MGNGRLLAIERSGWSRLSVINWGFSAKVYLLDLNTATDIKHIKKIATTEMKTVQSIAKQLLIDFDREGPDQLDNIEAMALGPIIDGKQTLIFSSDNNFNPLQKNQFLLYQEDDSKILTRLKQKNK